MRTPLAFTVAFASILSAAARAQTTTRVSPGVFSGSPSLGSLAVALSSDSAFVAFQSQSSSLVPGDTNGVVDLFAQSLATGAVERVNVSSGGSQSASAAADPSISSDGRYVAFSSFAGDLVPGDTNGMSDIFVRDLVLGLTERVSVASDGTQGNSQAYSPSISGDGRYVAFQSHASNLEPGGSGQVFVHDCVTGQTSVVSVDSSGVFSSHGAYRPSISADGRYVAFQSASINLTPGDALPGAGGNGWDVFVHDRTSGVTQLVSATPSGAYPNAGATDPDISADGRFVAFQSGATNIVAGDAPNSTDVFVRDLVAQQTVRASDLVGGGTGTGSATSASLSADGRYVAFASNMQGLISGQIVSTFSQIYRHDLQTGATELVSLSDCGIAGSGLSSSGYANSHAPSIGGDGSRVVYASFANTLVPGDLNNAADLYLRDFTLPVQGIACSFCTASTTSLGCVPTMTTSGVPSASSTGGFTVSVVGTEGDRIGIAFFNSYAGYTSKWTPASTSYLCMQSAGRMPPLISTGTQGQCDGVYTWDWTAHLATNPSLAALYVAGRPVFFQSWFRDPPAPTGTNLSGGIQFLMQP